MSLFKTFPSYDYLLAQTIATFKRFPFAILSALLGTVIAVSLIGDSNVDQAFIRHKLLMLSGLGLPLFTALTVFAEKKYKQASHALMIQIAGLILLIGYYFSLPENVSEQNYHLVRFLLLIIGLHFLTAFIAFTGKDQVASFWQFNKSLFLRFLLASLYSSVLYLGLAIALAAADHLFGVDVDPDRYAQLWMIIAITVQTWIFLAGLPRLDELDREKTEYPKGLKLFSQYILLPLVALYFAILISYEAKILITMNWPKGWVSQLVLWYSVVGILSLLFLYPLRERIGNLWINVFSKWFFRALLPLIGLLYWAIFKRISDYGITENRYFVLAMAIGLTIVVFYFIFSRLKDIRIIPIVLCLIAFLSSFGPWGAFSISKNSQLDRLESLMISNNILVKNRIRAAEILPAFEDRKELSSITDYLIDMHGLNMFADYFDDSVYARIDSVKSYSQASEITKAMGFAYISKYRSAEMSDNIYLITEEVAFYNITGYDYTANFSMRSDDERVYLGSVESSSCYFQYDSLNMDLEISFTPADSNKSIYLTINLLEPLDLIKNSRKLNNENEMPPEVMTITGENEYYRAKILFSNLSYEAKDEIFQINSMSGDLYISKK